jgi:enoyl-CoA hydratase
MTDRAPDDRIIARRDGAVGTIVINNPARRNAVSDEMWRAIADAVVGFADDDAVRVITLQGAGGNFAAGADISRFEAERAAGLVVAHGDSAFSAACAAVHDAAKPTVAIIRGFCLGGGMALAISCDLRIAAEDARFGIPAARLSIGYGVGGLRRVVELAGLSACKEILYTARQYSAAEALRLGLVNRVLPAAELDAFAADYIATIADNAPLTIAGTKAALAEMAKDEAARDWTRAEALIARANASADHAEATRAFLEKRRPVFKGR